MYIERTGFNNRNLHGTGLSCTGANRSSEQLCLALLEAGSDTAVLVESKQKLKSQEIHSAVKVLAWDAANDKHFAKTGPVDREDSYTAVMYDVVFLDLFFVSIFHKTENKPSN